ncbi:Pectinesterase, partial [Rhizoctonia solani]
MDTLVAKVGDPQDFDQGACYYYDMLQCSLVFRTTTANHVFQLLRELTNSTVHYLVRGQAVRQVEVTSIPRLAEEPVLDQFQAMYTMINTKESAYPCQDVARNKLVMILSGPDGETQTVAVTLFSNVYFVYAGSYKEQVVINRANVKIYGQTSNALTYANNQATITNNVPASSAGSNDASGTVRVLATGVSIYNLNIANTYGKPVDQSQAIALSVQAGQFGCYGCKLTGYQDTLLANKGTQFYGKSYIEGAVDFIFGMEASIWITGSTINTIGNGYITASGRQTGDSNYYVIDKSSITGTGTQYLGRPWRNYARVVVQGTSIGSHVVAAGWSQWSSSSPNTDHILFGEYNNSGGGAWRTGRASFASNLSAGVSISTALGSTSWIDSAYL